jgi:nucleoside-diphosphate kinase
MWSGPSPIAGLVGERAWRVNVRGCSATNPLESEPGTIRGDLAIEVGRNVIHGSDSVENGEKEIALWFQEGELVEWDQHMNPWLRE